MRKIVLCGASCSGKTTIKQRLVEKGLKPGVSYTTREMRDGEEDGVDYRFVTKDRFSELIQQGSFFEYDDTFDDHYGTSNEDFENCDVFILTPQAVEKLKATGLISRCTIVYLTAPIHVRIKRATERGDSIGKILQRISNDSAVFAAFTDYDICLETREGNMEEIMDIIC